MAENEIGRARIRREVAAAVAWWIGLSGLVALAFMEVGVGAVWGIAFGLNVGVALLWCVTARVRLPGLRETHRRLSERRSESRFLAEHRDVVAEVHAMRMGQMHTVSLLLSQPYAPTDESAAENHVTPVELRELAIWAGNEGMLATRADALLLAERIETAA